MQIWTVANHKGGVGRTTTALMLARHLATRGSRVLLVDLDPHASLTRAFGLPVSASLRGSFDLFMQGATTASTVAMHTGVERVDLMAGHDSLAIVDRRSSTKLTTGLNFVRGLHSVAARYDFAIVDCPAMIGMLATTGILACDRLIIPTLPDPLALHGLAATYRTAGQLEVSRKGPIAKSILPTMYDRRTRSSVDNTLTLQDQYGVDVWQYFVPEDTRLRDPSWLTSAEMPRGRGPDAYRRVLDWILGLPVPVRLSRLASA